MRVHEKTYYHHNYFLRIAYTLIILFISYHANASSFADSLLLEIKNADDTSRIHILNQLAAHYQFADAAKAKHYLDLALAEAQQENFKPGEADALRNMGVYYLLQREYELSKTYTSLALRLFNTLGQQKGIAECYKNLGVADFYTGNFSEAMQHYQQALPLFQKLNDLSGQAKCLANLGLIHDHYGNYQKALHYFLQSLKINEKIGSDDGMASSYGYIAYVYHNLNEFHAALAYQQKALKIFETTGNKARIGGLLSDMGNNYLLLKDYSNALDYYQRALAMATETGDAQKEAFAFNNMGAAYKGMEQFELALTYYTKALHLKEKLNDKRTLSNTLNNIAEIHTHLANYSQAIAFAQKGLALAREGGAKKDQQNLHLVLSKIYEAQANPARALAHYQQYSSIRDSIFNEEKARQIAEMQTKYDVEKKEQEIAAQQLEISLLEKNKITERNLRFALMASTALFILLAIFIYSRYNTKRKTAQVLDQKNREIESKNEEIKVMNKELEKRMLRAQMDPHFIFNALNAIQHLITINDKTSALKYLSKFSKLVRQTLENSVSHKVPIADEIRMLEYYIELESLRFSNQFEYAIEIDEGLDIYNAEIPFLLLQPYVENAIVHGLRHKKAQGLLKVQLQSQQDHLLCVIEDNGIGRKQAVKINANHRKHHISRGMSVTHQRLAALNKDQKHLTQLKVTDLYDHTMKASGTKVEISIPLEVD